MYSIHICGLCNAGCFEHGLKGGMNYRIWVCKCVNGGQGGDINSPWKAWPSILGLGLLCWFVHSQHGCMSSSSALCGGVKVRRFDCDGRYISLSGLTMLFVCLVWFQCVLLIVALIFCCMLQGMKKLWVVDLLDSTPYPF